MTPERHDPERVAQLLAEAVGGLGVVTDPHHVDDFLALVAAVNDIEVQARSMLCDAVVSARSGGATWAAIGHTLGMTKQAAQKRFAVHPTPDVADLDPNERILGPVTAFDELAELELAGAYGWHSVDFGPYFHRVVRSSTRWEHKRVSMLGRTAKKLERQGWQLIRSEFPFTYLKRDLGTPALVEGDPSP